MPDEYRKFARQLRLPESEFVAPEDCPAERRWADRFANESPPAFGHDIKQTLFPLLGAAPTPSDAAVQVSTSLRIESNPVHFYYKTLFSALARSQRDLASFVGASASNLVMVPNVEFGIAAVLNSVDLADGDEIIAFDLTYAAVLTAAKRAAELKGASVTLIPLSMPITSDSVASDLQCFLDNRRSAGSIAKIRLAIIEHVTSPTALILPIHKLIRVCRDAGILALIDGAHALGQFDLALDDLSPDFYVSNAHKWLCTPRGAAFLYVRPEHQEKIHPVITTWGAHKGIQGEFVWQGTMDYRALLSLTTAVRMFNWLGKHAVFDRNRNLTRRAGEMLVHVWETHFLAEDPSMYGCMVTVATPRLCARIAAYVQHI
eukprot:jgi/Hompol1/5819/HPOL_004767-RA